MTKYQYIVSVSIVDRSRDNWPDARFLTAESAVNAANLAYGALRLFTIDALCSTKFNVRDIRKLERVTLEPTTRHFSVSITRTPR